MSWLLHGLADGFAIALLALALSVVFVGTRVIALSLGGLFALAPFMAWHALGNGASVPAAVAGALAVPATLGWLTERAVHRPLARRGSTLHAQVIASLGLYLMTVQGLSLLWTSEPLVLLPGAGRLVRQGDLALTHSQLALLAVGPLLLALFFLWLRRTQNGLRLRALSDNPVELQLRGHDTDRLRGASCLIGGTLAACAGLLVAWDSGFDAGMGLHALLPALAAMILGGRHSFAAVVTAALAIGLLRAGIGMAGDARWQDAATFLVLFAVLLARPQGLSGPSTRVESAP